jgi:hypothetical protein
MLGIGKRWCFGVLISRNLSSVIIAPASDGFGKE